MRCNGEEGNRRYEQRGEGRRSARDQSLLHLRKEIIFSILGGPSEENCNCINYGIINYTYILYFIYISHVYILEKYKIKKI